MMRLRVIYNASTWKILAPVDAEGVCEVFQALESLAADKKTKATAAGIRALWSRMNRMGPRSLGTDNYHRIDDDNEINEFIRRDHRILCFEAEGALVICSHVIAKSSRKTPKAEKDRAIELRNAYKAAVAAKKIEVV